MAKILLPDTDALRQLLDYDPETGTLTWKSRAPSLFKTERAASVWNARCPGKQAFITGNGTGKYGSIWGRFYYAHRIIWKIVHGYDPDTIDHINGDPLDNRLCNLRSVQEAENAKNRRRRDDNNCGCTGVSPHRDRWVATIRGGGKQLYLGIFDSIEDAIVARKAAEMKLGFHENHDRTQKEMQADRKTLAAVVSAKAERTADRFD